MRGFTTVHAKCVIPTCSNKWIINKHSIFALPKTKWYFNIKHLRLTWFDHVYRQTQVGVTKIATEWIPNGRTHCHWMRFFNEVRFSVFERKKKPCAKGNFVDQITENVITLSFRVQKWGWHQFIVSVRYWRYFCLSNLIVDFVRLSIFYFAVLI
jgi:hypothetical protein